ncbi:MAG: CDP-glycerol glycerophosphotransferase family protein, partial [Marmoricola sp.]|nr:CDP-glycerol glycerophosphotransferase family protein [Marmoricola sp.]
MSPSLRDRAQRGAGRVLRRARAGRPVVTVVVEASGREPDVLAAIDSVRDQDERRLEILVVLVDEVLRSMATDAVAGDWRVRVVDALGADPAAVRRIGAEHARAPRLLFLPPRQRLTRRALRHLLPAGDLDSAVVAGGATPIPAAPLLGRVLVPRATWLSQADDGEPAGQTAALRLLGEDHVAVEAVTLRDDGPVRSKPFERPDDPRPRLFGRIAHDDELLRLPREDARPPLAAALLARELPTFLLAVERYDQVQWSRLQAHTAGLVRLAGAALADVPLEDRVLAWLASEDRRGDLTDYVADRRFAGGQFPTHVRDGLIRADLGVDNVPDHVLAVTEAESPLRARVERTSPHELVLWAAIQRLDEESPDVRVTLGGRPIEAALSDDPAVTRWMGEVHQRHDRGVVTVRWPEAPADGQVLEVEMVDRGVRRSTFVDLDPDAPTGRKHPDLSDDEAGPYRQRLLQQEYLAVTEPVDPRLVYFQAFLGQAPTDHPGAIQEALERVRPDGTRVVWCVADSSVRVPAGAEPVQLRSREWYDVLARAGWIVTNVELEPWFRRRAGQEVLETYHGYPSKAMGLSQWRARDLTPTHVEQMLRRTSGMWNNLLTPIPEMDRYYRESYAFDGRIISQGYPRDDALVADGHEQRRHETRARLGIGADQTAILYAPTWRDDLATNFRSAQAVLHLDVEQAARELGPGHVVLLRGHRFHASTDGGAQVLDVTSYPEINDLLLAADAAVLDYSSLRFDFALTGRPMVFLVPDLRAYTEQTRG